MEHQRGINDCNQFGFIWHNLLSEDRVSGGELTFTRKHGQPVVTLTSFEDCRGVYTNFGQKGPFTVERQWIR